MKFWCRNKCYLKKCMFFIKLLDDNIFVLCPLDIHKVNGFKFIHNCLESQKSYFCLFLWNRTQK